MASFGWILLAGAFLVLIMVANNSWPFVWARLQRGIPQPGEGNTIVPTPPADAPSVLPPVPGQIPVAPSQGNAIVPTPDQPGTFDPTVPLVIP